MSEGQLPETWFCNVCNNSRHPPTTQSAGVFGVLILALDRKNPVAFCLPKDVREYFEGVKTGDEGEYEEIPLQKPAK